MSGEFRWITSSYFHDALIQAAECGGDCESHEVSRAMSKLYAALAPIERGCAWFEAGDSGSYAPTMALLQNLDAAMVALAELKRLKQDAEQLISAALREQEKIA